MNEDKINRRVFLQDAGLAAVTTVLAASANTGLVRAAAQAPAKLAEQPMTYAIADAHTHYTDWFQNTEGVDSFVECLDAAKVSDAVFFGIPLRKMWTPENGLDKDSARKYDDSRRVWAAETDYIVAAAYSRATAAQKKRLHPFICGINGNDMLALDHVKRMIQLYPGVWQGIGEIFSHHDLVSWTTYGEIPRPDSAAYDMVYKFAARYKMPVNIHSNITSSASASSPLPLFKGQMETALQNNPDTVFIWAHIGISNSLHVYHLPEIAAELLEKYPNLNFDLSWLVFENDVAKDGKVSQEWLSLLEKHSDRFMVGSDFVGHFKPVEAYRKEIRKYDLLLNALKPAAAVRIARDNFLALLPGQGVILSPEDRIVI